ncbi:MAG: DUF1566 domain-containing protein [Deltaproteobacteria bacterium]|jgi:hypothetical protein|nr:DUF1566 domain-containing protein [Deltaproteobacteria bacterium]
MVAYKFNAVWALFFVIFLLLTVTLYGFERFTDNGDGTVTDHKTGLMWAKNDNQGDINWKQGERWVKFTFPYSISTSYNNWRLPTLEELLTLYVRDKSYPGYETDCGQKVRIVPEIRITCGWLWSSEKKSITARVYNFNRGYHYTDRMVHKKAYRVLPVRSLKWQTTN